ncbi:hypothetical protein LCGC14_0322910 [marine sediment metagenome]|uniref:Uncharacterized protein n=1 Tax=marine sediment metagenome TaxID=412755 RepID=A0A0F9U185_9ZZZZ
MIAANKTAHPISNLTRGDSMVMVEASCRTPGPGAAQPLRGLGGIALGGETRAPLPKGCGHQGSLNMPPAGRPRGDRGAAEQWPSALLHLIVVARRMWPKHAPYLIRGCWGPEMGHQSAASVELRHLRYASRPSRFWRRSSSSARVIVRRSQSKWAAAACFMPVGDPWAWMYETR